MNYDQENAMSNNKASARLRLSEAGNTVISHLVDFKQKKFRLWFFGSEIVRQSDRKTEAYE
jgi:hypothetical protein